MSRLTTGILAAAVLLAGCAEQAPVAPPSTERQTELRGEVVASSWSSNSAGVLTYDGTYGTEVGVDGAQAYKLDDAEPTPLSPSERAMLRAGPGVAFSPATAPDGAMEPTTRLRAGKGGPVAQKRRQLNDVLPDGRRQRTEFLWEDGAPEGRPPKTVSVFVDGRLQLLTDTRYRKNGSGHWQATWIRTTTFNEDGTVRRVSELDLSNVKSGPQRIGGLIGSAFREGCEVLAGLLGPAPLSAQTGCRTQRNAFLAKVVYFNLSTDAVLLAVKPCVTASGCILLALALANEVLATLEMSVATTDYHECLDALMYGEPIAPPVQDRSDLSNSSSGTTYCTLYIYEVSWDGGNTWTEFARETVCVMEA